VGPSLYSQGEGEKVVEQRGKKRKRVTSKGKKGTIDRKRKKSLKGGWATVIARQNDLHLGKIKGGLVLWNRKKRPVKKGQKSQESLRKGGKRKCSLWQGSVCIRFLNIGPGARRE